MPDSLRARGLALSLSDGRELFARADLVLDHRPTALVGANGVGKTRLCRVLAGLDPPDRGRVEFPGRVHLLGHEPASATELHDRVRLARWCDRFDVPIRPAHSEVEGSGGERQRLRLAQAFASGADLLILDEPGVHLDRTGREALLDALREFRGLLLVVSHQPEILDVAERVLELSAGRLHDHALDFAAYRRQRAIEQAAAARELAQARRELAQRRAQRQVARERAEGRAAQGRRARAAGSQGAMQFDFVTGRAEAGAGRREQRDACRLDQARGQVEDARARLRLDADFDLRLPASPLPAGRSVLRASGLRIAVGGRVLVEELDLDLRGPVRLAVTGPNGVGKSLLLACLAGRRRPERGDLVRAPLPLGHIGQDAEPLRSDAGLLEGLQDAQPALTRGEAMQRLVWFGFGAERFAQPAGSLSAGERVRFALACALAGPRVPDLLLLDEPDNHLDLPSLAIVTHALAQFRGALVLVSHGETFLADTGITRRLRLDGQGGARLES